MPLPGAAGAAGAGLDVSAREVSLEWRGADAWASLPFEPLVVGGATVGSVRSGKGPSGATLSFLAVDGAGHMVPMDNGAAAALALRTLVARK